MKRSIPLFACILLIFLSRITFSQGFDLLPAYNGDFENGFTSWRFFEVPNNIGSKAEITTADVAHGSKAVKITFVPADASVIDRGFDNWDANVPVIGGVKYTAKVMAKTSSETELYLSIVLGFFDGSGSVVDEGSEQVLLGSTYQEFSINRTAPAEAASCWIAFRMFDANGTRVGGTLYLDHVQLFGQGESQVVLRPRVMPTLLPTDDVPVASIDITETPFSAKNDGSEDATTAFQAAINYAANAGGAVIFVPSGRYRFDGNLILREKVILRGDWQNPDEGSSDQGTILMPFAGSGAMDGTPFLQLERGSGVKNLTIWYPDQSLSGVTPYPWTIQCNPNTPNGPGDNTSVINVTLVNSYQGIRVGPAWNELHYIRNVYGTPLKTGIWLSQTTDIGRIMNVHFEPKYWSQSGLANSPDENALLSWLGNNGEGIVMGRSDWEYIYDVTLSGYQVGMRIFKYSDVGPNGVIYGLHIEHSHVGIQLDDVNGIGFIITGSTINASAGEKPVCVRTSDTFTSIVQFNSCRFGGAPETAISLGENSTGRLTFQNCVFEDWGETTPAIRSEEGSLAVLGCEFKKDKLHLYLGKDVSNAQILDNVFSASLKMENNSKGEILVSQEPLDLAKLDVPPHPFAAEPRPATDDLFIVQDFGALGDGATDDTDAFQAALNAAGQNGGGTVYVPGGWYRIASHLAVPTGVELRGIWDVPHHTISKGTVLLAFEGKGNPDATPFIALQPGAGVRGLTVWYPQQNSANIQAYPWSIQAHGANCWIKDVTLGNTYQGIDLATFPCENHYVSYVGGSPLKTGIYVSQNSGEGWVENVQFNPHYWLRSSGFPKNTEPDFNQVISFQQSELDAFKFGSCAKEHVLGTFVYAAKMGLDFTDDGAPCNADVFLHGTDAGSHGVHIASPGASLLNFVNSQLVLLGATPQGIITTDDPFNGLARFFGVLAWGDHNGPTTDLNGSGTVIVQQIHTENNQFRINGGKAFLQNVLISRDLDPQYVIGTEAKEVKIFASVAENGFKMSSQAGDRVEADYNFKQGQKGIRIKTGWEEGEKQNDWNNTFFVQDGVGPFSGETAPQCRAEQIDGAHTGSHALHVAGHDDGSSHARVYFKTIASQIPVFGTTMLSYWLLPTDDGGRSVHIDILFTDGTRLTDFAPVAQDSLPLIAARGTVGQWEKIICPIGAYASGKTTQTILVGYRHETGAQDFSAFIDDLDISTPHILPAPWQETNIGNAVPEGYTIYDNESFFMKAGGLGFGMTGDTFHFVYQKLEGDAGITAKLESVDNLGVGAFAGIMMRRSDSTASSFAAVVVSPRYGVYSKWRMPGTSLVSSTGHRSISTQTPLWFKLVRKGNSFATYYSSDGTHWGEPLKQVTVPMDSAFLVGLAAAGGFGATLLNAQFSHVRVSKQVTSIKSDPELNLPRVFRISQNYPNPFNGQTEIEFDLPKDGHVQIAVYNLMGQKIKTLVDQFQPAGFYKIDWQGRDENDSAVSSGVYYYQIRFHQTKIVKKMVFLQ